MQCNDTTADRLDGYKEKHFHHQACCIPPQTLAPEVKHVTVVQETKLSQIFSSLWSQTKKAPTAKPAKVSLEGAESSDLPLDLPRPREL